MTDDKSIERAAQTVEKTHGKLDILVNNAGTAALDGHASLREAMRYAFDTNAAGPAVVTETFVPLLKKSSEVARIINVSSAIGSIEKRQRSEWRDVGMVQYRASKAALNMVSACQWADHGPDVKVFAYCPGYTVSNLSKGGNTAENGARATRDSVSPLVDVLEGKRDDEAGSFLHGEGQHPW